ncbi:MAG: hypothetical protein ACXW28_12915, partial [Thermoanaerobaculia bacterium]
MKRKIAIGIAAVLLLVTALGVTAAFRHPADEDDPTFRVESAAFRRQVTAEGTLKAVKATPVSTPNQSNRPLKIAWIETDGALVRKGDVIVR